MAGVKTNGLGLVIISLIAPWYFRTLESWFSLFVGSVMSVERFVEPVDLKIGRVVSLLLVGKGIEFQTSKAGSFKL